MIKPSIEERVDKIESILQPNGRCLTCGGGEFYWKHDIQQTYDYHAFVKPWIKSDKINFEQLRIDNKWPTPNHMRKTADALDILTFASYGKILRWMADECDKSAGIPK